jgi:DNA repair exonuclease SbcCD ATPase subunit
MFKEAKERYLQYIIKNGGVLAYDLFKREFKIQLEFERNLEMIEFWEESAKKRLNSINKVIDNKVRAYKAELQVLKQELESIEFPHELTQVEKLEKLKQELETIPRNPYEELFQEFSKYETL